ncbi:MAG: trehalose-phosphatase [Candidatus Omnitrophota bacterium]
MKYLFQYWGSIYSRIERSRHIFLFLDYDGTLTPIVSRPQDALLRPGVKSLLKALRKRPNISLAIISGRSLKDVKSMVGIKGLIYAGNHGFEIDNFKTKISAPKTASIKLLFKKLEAILKQRLKNIEGVKIENKIYTLSIHFRLVSPKERKIVKDIFFNVIGPFLRSKDIRATSGKMVFELRPPVEWHKGKTVEAILKSNRTSLPIYIGDDTTDEDAFKVVEGKGISIFVGPKKSRSKAEYFLRDTDDVGVFLARLAEQS